MQGASARPPLQIIGGQFQILRSIDVDAARPRHEIGNQRLRVEVPTLQKAQECRYLVKDFGTSQSPKSTRQRNSRYCPDR
ncbi:MAG: hypothetical protein AB2814_11695, partial [Candidatus Sedimenticola endophacoides]